MELFRDGNLAGTSSSWASCVCEFISETIHLPLLHHSNILPAVKLLEDSGVRNYKPIVSSPVNFDCSTATAAARGTFWALYSGAIGRMGAGKLTFDR